MGLQELVVRLLLAVVAGAILGWEREWRQKPAGLKTHILVTLGSAAFVLAALRFFEELGDRQTGADMMKVIGGVVGGVGFLGAGSIMRTGGNVHGLTTAATIWLAAAIGVAVGFGYVALAGMCVLLALLTLIAFELVERVFFPPTRNDHPEENAADGKQSANP
jgi:putative Mg2+ transporter-C (MgtC) family protein